MGAGREGCRLQDPDFVSSVAPPPLPLSPSPSPPLLLFYLCETDPCKTQWPKTTSYYVSCLWLSWGPPDNSAPCNTSWGHSQGCLWLLDGLCWRVAEGSVHISGVLGPLPVAVPPVGPSPGVVVSGWPDCSQGCWLPRRRSRRCF